MAKQKQKFYSTLMLATLFCFAPAASGFAQQATIHFWNVGTNDDALMYRRLAKEFEAETGIRVHVTAVGWGNYRQKFMTALAAQLPPDLGAVGLNGPYDYGRVGGLVNLSREFPQDLAALQRETFAGLWPQMTYQGDCYGIPNAPTTLFLFYRKDIFARLGLQPPRTWREMEEVLSALDRNDYQYNYEWTRENGWAADIWLAPYGLRRYGGEPPAALWDRPEFVRGVQTAVRFWNLHHMPIDKNAKPIELFSLGEKDAGLLSPMFIDIVWKYKEIEAKSPHLAGKWAMAPLPAADNGKRSLVGGGTALVIFKLSQHQQAAMRWARHLMSPQVQYEILMDCFTQRGERGVLHLSPNRKMYEQFPSPLDSAATQNLVAALESIDNPPTWDGATEADRHLDLSFQHIRGLIAEYLQARAQQNNLSVWDYKKALAAGQFAGEQKQLRTFADSVTAAVFAKNKPAADAALARAQEEYRGYYKGLLAMIRAKEKAWDILDHAKLFVLALMALAAVFVLRHPVARRHRYSYLFIAPAAVLLMVFLLIPIAVALYLSFTQYNPVLPLAGADWVGLKNYANLLASPVFWASLQRSLYFALFLVPIQLILGILLAAGLDESLRPDKLYKFAFFSPLVTSVVSVALIWTALYLGARYGWINALLLKLGFIRDPLSFLRDEGLFLGSVIVMTIWHGLAFVILINLAGLQNIPRALYEAAMIDGAGALQRFFKITLPALRPQITFLALMGTIGAVQAFEQIFMFGGGAEEAESKFGPGDAGLTLVPLLYRAGFEDFRMGEASALAYLLFAAILALTLANWKMLMRED